MSADTGTRRTEEPIAFATEEERLEFELAEVRIELERTAQAAEQYQLAVQRIRELHSPFTLEPGLRVCQCCNLRYPCITARTLCWGLTP